MKFLNGLRWHTVIALATAALLANAATFAEEDGQVLSDNSGQSCISLNRINNTHVLDDSNILFYALGKKVYRNQLPRKCPGLARADSFMYKTSMSQLCKLDMITVLNNMGFGFMQGATCGLGKFYPIDAERAKELRGQKAPASERLEAEED